MVIIGISYENYATYSTQYNGDVPKNFDEAVKILKKVRFDAETFTDEILTVKNESVKQFSPE